MISEQRAPKAADFERVWMALRDEARRSGQATFDVTSGDLHRRVGGYPGPDHRMPVCCEVMRKRMGDGDVVISEPPKGKGASLRIRYQVVGD